jgi:osmotically-inducible protein OsmY
VKEPPVTVTAERKSKDELINEDVVKLLASDTRLSGYIGVETRDQIVTLNGRVTSAGQTWRATRIAQSVEGVREVRNHLRTRVGGMS